MSFLIPLLFVGVCVLVGAELGLKARQKISKKFPNLYMKPNVVVDNLVALNAIASEKLLPQKVHQEKWEYLKKEIERHPREYRPEALHLKGDELFAEVTARLNETSYWLLARAILRSLVREFSSSGEALTGLKNSEFRACMLIFYASSEPEEYNCLRIPYLDVMRHAKTNGDYFMAVDTISSGYRLSYANWLQEMEAERFHEGTDFFIPDDVRTLIVQYCLCGLAGIELEHIRVDPEHNAIYYEE